ncbi:hypothetical protein ACFRAQ_36165 [Nocardia sp. NPDC056611]
MHDDEPRQCVMCGATMPIGRWMLCADCQDRVEANNRENWGGTLNDQ